MRQGNLSTSALTLLLSLPPALAEPNWSEFRGPQGRSIASSSELPLEWNGEEDIAWKTDLKGYGQSSPLLWEDQVIVTSTGGDNKEHLYVEAFDRASGKQNWLKTFAAAQQAKEVSKMISQGAPTPVVDQNGIYAFFESGNLVALTHGGEPRWERNLVAENGPLQGNHGIGTSPVDAGDHLILLVDHDGPSYLLAIDKATGKDVWKQERDARVSWTSPLVVEHDGVTQVIVSSNGRIESVRLDDGKTLWWLEGLEGNTVASPTVRQDLVAIGCSAPQQSRIIRLGQEGDLNGSPHTWLAKSVTNSFGSPILFGEIAYFVNRAGILQAVASKDGESLWEERLPESTWASPIINQNRVYFFSKNGSTTVIDGTKPEFTVLAQNHLEIDSDDKIYGVAAGQTRFFARTGTQIIAVKGKH